MLNSCPVLLKRFLPCLSERVWIHLVSYCDVDDDHLTTSTLSLGHGPHLTLDLRPICVSI